MAQKPIICPQDCQTNHSEHRINMAEVKKDLSYIKDEISDLKVLVSKAIQDKADKTEVERINKIIWWVATSFILGTLGFIIWLVQEYVKAH
jgi:hypothetical protein